MLGIALLVCAQRSKRDSLVALLPHHEGAKRVLLLHDIIKSSWTTEPDLVVDYGREAIQLSQQIDDLALLSASYRIFGGLYNYLSEIDSGKYYKLKALEIALEVGDPKLLALSYNNVGVTLQTLGNYVESLNYFYRAYLIGKTIPDDYALPIILANVSEIYYDLQEYDSSVLYANKAVYITQANPENSTHLLTLNALARAKLAKKEYTEAKELYGTIIEIGNAISDKRYVAFANQGLGRLYASQQQGEMARKYYSMALSAFTELSDNANQAELYKDLGELKLQAEPDSAHFFIRRSLTISNDLQLKDLIIDNYRMLIVLFTNRKQYDSLRYYQRLFQDLENERRQESTTQSIQGMFAKMKDDQMKQRVQSQSLELERKTIQTNYIVAFSVITTLFAGMIFRYYRKQKRLGEYLTDVNKEITAKNEVIDQTNQELQALNNEKNDLINIVAHDLKNPLSNILWSVEMIRDQETEDTTIPLEIIEGSASRLIQMVTKILDVEAIEKGLANMVVEAVSISSILQDICKDYTRQAQNKHISIEQKILEDVTVQGDSTFVYQVLENIVSNAIKYSPLKTTVTVALFEKDSMATVEIKDEGPGISKADQEQLFEMYQKLSASPTANEHSSGLGLSIAKKYVDAMDGKIWCISEPDQGSSFFIQLPLA